MLIPIKQIIIQESILERIANLSKDGGIKDSSSKMLSRSDKINPILDPNTQMSIATGFKKEQGLMKADEKYRDFITGVNSGTQASAKDLFNARRTQELNQMGVR